MVVVGAEVEYVTVSKVPRLARVGIVVNEKFASKGDK